MMAMKEIELNRRALFILALAFLLALQFAWFLLLSFDHQLVITPCSLREASQSPCAAAQQGLPQEQQMSNAVSSESKSVNKTNDDAPNVSDEAFLQLIGPSDPRRVVFEAKYNLVWLGVPYNKNITTKDGGYSGVQCSFCPVNWKQQKQEPNTVPRYENAYKASGRCNSKNPLAEMQYDFADIVKMTRRYDQLSSSKIRHLHHAGFIFHESRVGSTLVANMLTVSNPDTSRVYSEPYVLKSALKSNNKQLVEDVLYMLGRTNGKEKRAFYKLKSEAVRYIQAMPSDIPWIFLYREPKEVMASHFHPTEHDSTVVCLNERKKPHVATQAIAKALGHPDAKKTPDETFCALRLASLCDAAIRQREQTGKGRFVNYNTLPESLWESIAPDHFGLQLSKTSIARMKDISGVYSKGRTDNSSKWVEDKDAEKKKLINEKQQAAARDILQPFYNEMEKYANET